MRPYNIVLLSAALCGCHPTTEVAGMYVHQDSTGILVPCNDSRITMVVKNAALTSRYRAATQSNQPMFVRLRGVKGHEGSIYGGQRYFDVQQVLELRPRGNGECPGALQPLTTVVH
jgi:N-terminal of Par3 and HAL proteins